MSNINCNKVIPLLPQLLPIIWCHRSWYYVMATLCIEGMSQNPLHGLDFWHIRSLQKLASTASIFIHPSPSNYPISPVHPTDHCISINSSRCSHHTSSKSTFGWLISFLLQHQLISYSHAIDTHATYQLGIRPDRGTSWGIRMKFLDIGLTWDRFYLS